MSLKDTILRSFAAVAALLPSNGRKNPMPQNHLRVRDVHIILGCPTGSKTREEGCVRYKNGDSISYLCTVTDAGRNFEFTAATTTNNITRKTLLQAALINPGVYEIQKLVIDDAEKPLKNAKKIYDALNWIGMNQVRRVYFDSLKVDRNQGPSQI